MTSTRRRLIRRTALILTFAALAGCTTGPSALRDTSVPIASTTRFDADRFAGSWRVVARLAAPGDISAQAPERFDFTATDGGFAVLHYIGVCSGPDCAFQKEETAARVSGPGRLRMKLDGKQVELWLLWVDADYRTAAIGTPSGAFGWIMEKGSKTTPPDRLAAAKDILDWMGYDLSKLIQIEVE